MRENRRALLGFLCGDADVGVGEHDATNAATDKRAGAGETGLVRHVRHRQLAVAEAECILLGVTRVQAPLPGATGFRGAVCHSREGAVEAGGTDTAVGTEEYRPDLEAAAGAEPAELGGHAEEDFVLEGATVDVGHEGGLQDGALTAAQREAPRRA